MTRRKLVALVSVCVLFMIGLVVFSAGLFLTHTDAGRERLRAIAMPFIKGIVKNGSIYVGHVGGSFIGGLTIDSVAIRDKRGELFLSTGPIVVSYNWRDIVDQRIYISKARIEHPFVHIVQHETGVWNFKEIFASPTPTPAAPKVTNTRSFGDYIVLDSAMARNGTFLLSMPWHPDPDLRAAQRDSVIKVHLGNPEKAVTKTFDGYARTYAWRNGNGLISHIRLADPDSDKKFGQQFNVASLDVDEYVPTFKFHNLHAQARHLGDSVWFEVQHFDLPASTGTGHGKVWWGSDLPVRYDIAVRGDSVSLDDVNWVYPTLPRTGGGKLDLAIKNDPKNLQIVDFQLKNMDVTSTKSHLVGDMWFGTGASVLLVRNVNLRADPVDFDLLRTLAGKPFPYDWQGKLNGTVKARGGPLTHFYVDDAQGTFADAHVPGAVSRFSGKGELDILVPANTTFHGFDVNVGALDLRTPRFLFPGFPPLGGFIAGTATLDSSYLDVRFSNANLTHQDGPGEPSRVTGSGRVTDMGKFLAYDVNLNAEPLSLTMLQRSYPMLPPNLGMWSGPIVASGSSPDLTLKLELQGSNGALSYDGRVDIDTVGGEGATGHGQFSALNVASLFNLAHPKGTISGHYDVDVAGENATTLHGSAGVDLERTMLDSIRVYPSYARVRFADGRMVVDSARVHTDAATVVATGGIGLPKGSPDSLHLTADIDSLGGLRVLVLSPDTTLGLNEVAALDSSLAGAFHLEANAIGTFDALRLAGTLNSTADIIYKTESARALKVDFAMNNVLSSPSGTIDARLDSAVVAGVLLDHVTANATIRDRANIGFVLDATSHNGPTGRTVGAWSQDRGAQTIALDSLAFTVIDDHWQLANRPQLVIDSVGLRLDSLVLHNRDSAVVAMSGRVPSAGAAFAQLRASGLPLRDFGTLAQLPDTVFGTGGITVTASGTKANPTIDAHATFASLRFRDVDFQSAAIDMQHRNGRILATMNALRQGDSVITGRASLPVQLSLFAATPRRNDTLSVKLTADTTDLSILKLFVPTTSLPVVTGRLAAQILATGTWARPQFSGNVKMINGTAQVPALGAVTFVGINGTLRGELDAARQDVVYVQVAARTLQRDSTQHDSVSLVGWVKNIEHLQTTKNSDASFSFAIKADSLHAFNKRTVADLYISTPPRDSIVISGTVNSPVLTGTLNVDRGSIFLADADLARKLNIDLDTSSTDFTQQSNTLIARIKNNLQVQNASVTLGQDVRLRSAEANVRLAGKLDAVNSASGRIVQSSIPLPFTLVGQLQTVSGTYNLNLVLVQREFQVLPEGTVTFDGGPADRPLLDVRAQYNVKQAHDRDLAVIVNLKGRLPTPTVELSSSNADYAISPSDLVSYLVTGAPGFDFTSSQQQTLVSVLSPTVGALAAQGLRSTALGGFFDAFQIQTGTGSAEQQAGAFSQRNLTSYLQTSKIEAGKQIGPNLYLSFNTGYCQFQPGHLPVGAKAEYRFKPQISFQAGYDPPLGSGASCIAGQSSIIGFVPTPSQWSLALLHSWRF